MSALLIPANSSPRLRTGGDDAEEVVIPRNIDTLAEFRLWADSEAFPTMCRFCWLDGALWVDLEMEELFTHNLLKTAVVCALEQWNQQRRLGYVFSDGARLTHPVADLSCEPDAMFVSYDSMQERRVTLAAGRRDQWMELEGTPDLVVEIVSRTSVRKDTHTLRELYARAGIGEYWLIDARREPLTFEILRLTPGGYQSTECVDGQPVSSVLGSPVHLTTQTDPLGHPQFRVTVGP